MNRNAALTAASTGLAYLESAARHLECGDFVSARLLAEKRIRQVDNIPSVDVASKLQDLHAFIRLKERMGEGDAISILGRHYYVGTDADEIPKPSTATNVH